MGARHLTKGWPIRVKGTQLRTLDSATREDSFPFLLRAHEAWAALATLSPQGETSENVADTSEDGAKVEREIES